MSEGWMMRVHRWERLRYASTGTMLRVIMGFFALFRFCLVLLLVMLSEHTCLIEHDGNA